MRINVVTPKALAPHTALIKKTLAPSIWEAKFSLALARELHRKLALAKVEVGRKKNGALAACWH